MPLPIVFPPAVCSATHTVPNRAGEVGEVQLQRVSSPASTLHGWLYAPPSKMHRVPAGRAVLAPRVICTFCVQEAARGETVSGCERTTGGEGSGGEGGGEG